MNPLPVALALACILAGGACALWLLMPPQGQRIGAHWRLVPYAVDSGRWGDSSVHLSPALQVEDVDRLTYARYQEACLLIGWDPDGVLESIAGHEQKEVPQRTDADVAGLARLLLANADRYDFEAMPTGLQHKFTEVLASRLVAQIRTHLERTDRYLRHWQETFRHPRLGLMYPQAQPGQPPPAGLIAVLTRLDVSEWDRVVCEWPLWKVLVWAETKRVQAAFDERAKDNKSNGSKRHR